MRFFCLIGATMILVLIETFEFLPLTIDVTVRHNRGMPYAIAVFVTKDDDIARIGFK